jgi:WD40 repeat protein
MMRFAAALLLVAGAAAAADELPPITATFRATRLTRLDRVVGAYPWRHRAEITAVGFSPDGRRLVTAGGERRVKLWDAETGDELGTFGVAKGRTNAVGTSPGGQLVFAASSTGAIALWDAATGAPDALLAHGADVVDAAFSSGTRMISLSKDGTLKTWDLAAGAAVDSRQLDGGLALAPRGDRVLLGDGTVLDLATGKRLGTPLAGARIALCGNLRVAVAGGALTVVDLGRGPERTVARDLAPVVALAAAGGRALLAGADGRARAFDLETGRAILDAPAHEADIVTVAVAPNGRLGATASRDRTFKLWDLERGAAVAHDDGPRVLGVAWDGDQIVTATAPRFAVAAAGGALATAGDDGKVELGGHAFGRHAGGATAVAVSADGGRLLSAGLDGRVALWDVRRRHRIALADHGDPVLAAALSADGHHGAAADDTGRVFVVDRHGKTTRLGRHDGPATAVAVSADGKRVVSGGDDHTVRVWDLATRHATVLSGHRAAVTAVAVLGDLLLSAGKDGLILLWRDGAEVDRIDLSAADDFALALAPASDGKSFAAGTDRGVVLVFSLQ